MKAAAVGDIHVKKDSHSLGNLFEQVSKEADVLLLCGDVTDNGLVEEAKILASELKACSIPVIGVLGNHDYEAGKEKEISTVLKESGMHVLQGESVVIEGVGFVGTKGFAGGFDRNILPNWGEKIMKEFVKEGLNEVLGLENALTKLSTEKKVVILHYSPIRSTVIGEPEEIFPFLGLSRLADPINRFAVSLVVHGHAHHGTYEGKTEKGIPVYNVAQALLKKNGKDVAIFEL